jgi:hypothetical protein
MPFLSKKQMKLCYVLQKKNKNSNWNCEEWSKKTDYSKLPEYAKSRRSKSRSRSRSRRR